MGDAVIGDKALHWFKFQREAQGDGNSKGRFRNGHLHRDNAKGAGCAINIGAIAVSMESDLQHHVMVCSGGRMENGIKKLLRKSAAYHTGVSNFRDL